MIKKVANETLNYSIALCREKEVKGFIIDFHIRRYLNLHETLYFYRVSRFKRISRKHKWFEI